MQERIVEAAVRLFGRQRFSRPLKNRSATGFALCLEVSFVVAQDFGLQVALLHGFTLPPGLHRRGCSQISQAQARQIGGGAGMSLQRDCLQAVETFFDALSLHHLFRCFQVIQVFSSKKTCFGRHRNRA